MANAALMQARAAHAALADKFPDVGKEGLNTVLSNLLKQPIEFASSVIPANMEISSGKKKNDDLKQLCKDMGPILAKYPFNFNAKTDADASLNDVEHAFAPVSGLVWKYVQKSASDLVVLNKDQVWVEVAPPLPGLKVDPGLLVFLTAAQGMKKAFFNESGGIQQLHYTLRKVGNQTVGVRFSLDGQELGPDEVLQKPFRWPAGPGATAGAEGNEVVAGVANYGFGKFTDLWGVFRLFQNADPRPLLQKEVKWSYSRGEGGAARQQMNPPPKIEVVDFPGGVDLFNPQFFEELSCPQKAVSVN
jgi:type VI protein secretion system component VasK